MHFQAFSIGALVPAHHLGGTMHSVVHRACNLRLESDAMLTLLPSEKDDIPHGIRLNTASQPTFLNLLRVGQSSPAGKHPPHRRNRMQSYTFHRKEDICPNHAN